MEALPPPKSLQRTSVEEVSTMFGSLQQWYEHETTHPTGNDVRIAAYAQAALDHMAQPTDRFAQEIHKLIIRRTSITLPAHLSNLVLRGLQADFLEHEPDYPRAYDDPARWYDAIDELFGDLDRSSTFFMNMHFNVCSNIEERYKAIAIAARLLRHDVDDRPLNILDIGCSRQHGLRKLALASEFPFAPVTVGHLDTQKLNNDAPELIEDQEQTLRINRMLGALPVGQWLGIDYYPLDDDLAAHWAESCSFYPSELLDSDRHRAYKFLDRALVSGLRFFRDDFVMPQMDRLKQISPEAGYDIIFYSTMLYQNKPENRDILRQNGRELLAPGGQLLYQDFTTLESGDLVFPPEWPDFTYHTHVESAEEPGEVREFCSWRNGRCTEMVLGELAVEKLASRSA